MKNQIEKDFKRTWFICLILCIGMLPILANGYCCYVIALLLPYVLVKQTNVSNNCILVALFSACYFFSKLINGYEYSPSEAIFDLFFPFIMYQAGALIVKKQSCPTSAVLLLIAMAVCLAAPAIYNSIMDFVQTGELINISREILSNEGEVSSSATRYGMMLALMNGSLGILILQPQKNVLDRRIKMLIFCISIGALYSTVHLVTRTGIVIAAASLVIAMLLPPISKKRMRYVIAIMALSVGAFIYFFGDTVFLTEAMDVYDARNEDLAEAGQRTERWLMGIQQIFSKPFGDPKGLMFYGHYNYAHNLWLDAGIKGGIFCFFILMILTFIQMKNLLILYKSEYLNYFEKNILILMFAAMNLQSFVEPVIDGLPQFFWLYIFFISVVTNLNQKNVVSSQEAFIGEVTILVESRNAKEHV